MLQDVGATTNAKQMKDLAIEKWQNKNIIFGEETGSEMRSLVNLLI